MPEADFGLPQTLAVKLVTRLQGFGNGQVSWLILGTFHLPDSLHPEGVEGGTWNGFDQLDAFGFHQGAELVPKDSDGIGLLAPPLFLAKEARPALP